MSSDQTTAFEAGRSRSGAQSRTPRHCIADRYQVERELGSGGMGVVYAVRDLSTGQRLALKVLSQQGGDSATLLFRQEFHTLTLLRHPRIIGVHEYGIAQGSPYYTMDLLDGSDLRPLAPVPAPEACQYLRDVASSLALLHAHHLVHRDLTARNVRVTGDGRCKLIDFGALAPFGRPSAVVGTPPFVAPESLRRTELDQRSDLFSLGALAYFLLTGCHAFEVRSMGELETAWTRRPRRPSALVEERSSDSRPLAPIPEALDALVLSLLSIDPLGRPASAAEVLERLDAIASLEKDDEQAAGHSYLLSARLVGRDEPLAHARRLAAGAVNGAGGVLVVGHASGMGGTRLLTEVAVEARLAGAAVLQVDAAVECGPHGVARALVDKLVARLPAHAKRTAGAEVLDVGWVRLSTSERVRMLPPANSSASPGGWRTHVHAAIEEWLLRVAAEHPIALLVDNFQATDEGSAALLAFLAAAADRHALMIAVTMRKGDPVKAPPALRSILGAGRPFTLAPLTPPEVSTLVRSLFGDVPHSERWSQWLYDLTNGHPLHLMELCRFAVSRRIACYLGGAWVLPPELPRQLPERMEDALEDRLSNLSAAAIRLASAFSLHDRPLTLETSVMLAEAEGDAAFAALDELVSRGIVVGYGGNYRVAHEALRQLLRSRLTDAQCRSLHLKLGEHLLERSGADTTLRLEAGWHLFHGGEEQRGAEVLRQVGLDLVAADELAAAVPALEAAVEVYRRLGRPDHELVGLVEPLAFAGYYVDWRLADRYGDETLKLLADETGLTLTRRLRPFIGSWLSLVCGLVYAVILHVFGGRGGLRALSHRVAMLGGMSSALTGTATLCLDREGAMRRASAFEPFAALPQRHAGAFCYRLAQALVQLTEDRSAETIATLRQLRDQLGTPNGVIGFPEQVRPIAQGGVLFALGALESLMDEPLALTRAKELEACELRLYDMVACQVRANYHACRGEVGRMREYERQVEMFAIRSGTAWQAEVWAPPVRLVAFSMTGDIIGLKRTAEELQRLQQEIPSLAPYARLARGILAAARGETDSAITLIRSFVDEPGVQPRTRLGWATAVGVLATVHNEIGHHEEARALCARALEPLSARDREVVATTLRLEIQAALALAGLGRPEEAAELLDERIAQHARNEGPVTLGSLHEARAKIAHQMDDRAGLENHLAQMERWFRPTDNPALVARCTRLRDLLQRASDRPPASGAPVERPDTALALCANSDERASRALELLLESLGAEAGALFGVRRNTLEARAAHPETLDPQALLPGARQHFLDVWAARMPTLTLTRGDDAPLAGHGALMLSLDATGSGAPRDVGMVVFSPPVVLTSDHERLASSLARALHDFGDISTLRSPDVASGGRLSGT